MARILKPPAPLQLAPGLPSIFLAGSIEMGQAEDWQTVIEQGLADLDGRLAAAAALDDAVQDLVRRALDAEVLGDGVDGAAAQDGEAGQRLAVAAHQLRQRREVGAVAASRGDQQGHPGLALALEQDLDVLHIGLAAARHLAQSQLLGS